MLKAVIFDLGDTLVSYYTREQFPAVLRACLDECRAVLVGSGVLVPDDASVMDAALREDYEDPSFKVRPLEERLGAIFNLRPEVPAGVMQSVLDAFLGPIARVARRYDDSERCLVALKVKGLKTAILSNTPWGSPAAQWKTELVRHGLAGLVDVAVFCRDAGWRKPARQPFELVLRLLDIEPSEALMVGDSIKWDIEGAVALGIRAVHIDRTRTGGYAAQSIVSLDEVVELVDRERARESASSVV